MSSSAIKKQKQAGLILIALGIFIVIFIAAVLYATPEKISGFSSWLPAEKTLAYFEFPTAVDDQIARFINQKLKTDWQKDVLPWAGEKAAFTLINTSEKDARNEVLNNSDINPLFLIEIKNQTGMLDFLQSSSSGTSTAKIQSLKTMQLYFASRPNLLFVSPSTKILETVLKEQPDFSKTLSADADFINIRKNLNRSFFAYIKPQSIPSAYYAFLGKFSENLPLLSVSFPVLGLTADKTDSGWIGKSYALMPKDVQIQSEQPYTANLLPLLPPDFEIMISGQNLPNQIRKIGALMQNNRRIPPPEKIIEAALKNYLPGIPTQDLLSLANREFALTMNKNKALFITELLDPEAFRKIERIRESFNKTQNQFTSNIQSFKLPDDTVGAELVTNPAQIKTFSEIFKNARINGVVFNENNGLYDAIIQNKWLVSNDLSTLKKTMLLTKEPGPNFRDTDIYRQTLQLIMKNPEFLGVAVFPEGKFAFSKHTFADKMETEFIFSE